MASEVIEGSPTGHLTFQTMFFLVRYPSAVGRFLSVPMKVDVRRWSQLLYSLDDFATKDNFIPLYRLEHVEKAEFVLLVSILQHRCMKLCFTQLTAFITNEWDKLVENFPFLFFVTFQLLRARHVFFFLLVDGASCGTNGGGLDQLSSQLLFFSLFFFLNSYMSLYHHAMYLYIKVC